MGKCLIRLVSTRKMCKHSLDLNARKLCNPLYLFQAIFIRVKSDSSHAGIERNMHFCRLSHRNRKF